MSAPGVSTWMDTVGGVRRPGVSDFNGAQLEDNGLFPPDPQTMPTSALLNTGSLNAVSVGQVVPNATISVQASATPTLLFVTCCNTNYTIVSGTFTLTRVSAGVYTITWAAGVLPPQVSGDKGYLNIVLGAGNYAIGVTRIAGGIKITTTENGALTDLNFTVDIM